MPAELLALGAAFCYASGSIAVKFATQSGNVMLGLLISLASGTVAVGAVAAVTVDVWAVPLGAVILFALAGLVGAGGGRLLSMRAVQIAGTSVAVPVQVSSNPMIAIIAGVALFGEAVGWGRLVALGLILGGVWACARGGSANKVQPADLLPAERTGLARYAVLLLPLSAGAAYAGADILRKSALLEHADPIVGAFIGMVAALIAWLTIFLFNPRLRQPVRLSPSLGWFCLHGFLSASALVSLFSALNVGDLSVVTPIVSSQPVIVLILGAIVLRDLEKLRAGTIMGAAIVSVGISYLALT